MQYFIDKDKLEYFVYGGTSSASFNFIIMENDNLNSFENDFKLVEIPGRNGDLLINNKRKKNKEINIVAYADIEDLGNAKTVARNVQNWLCGEVKYKPLTFSDDLNSYEAIVVGPVEIKEELEGLLYVSFKFSCKGVA